MPLGPCPDTNSGQHKWRVTGKRTSKDLVTGDKLVYTFRVCALCGADDMVIDRQSPKGRHRRGRHKK